MTSSMAGLKPNILECVEGALVGAAVGGVPSDVQPEFFEWQKKSGTRFSSYFDEIRAGEYSDDTQLLLAVGRSILASPTWWINFAEVELPFWTLYERGGGGATKRAANNWATTGAPWLSKKSIDVERYFDAGATGW